MFLSLVIGRIKYCFRCKYTKNNKSIKNKLYFVQSYKLF